MLSEKASELLLIDEETSSNWPLAIKLPSDSVLNEKLLPEAELLLPIDLLELLVRLFWTLFSVLLFGKERALLGPPTMEHTDASAKNENLKKFFMSTSGISVSLHQ